MIHQLLAFFRDELNAYFRQKLSIDEDTIAFLDGENYDPLNFELGKITPLVVNLAEERTLRPADRYNYTQANGVREAGFPLIPLHVYMLFVGKFKDYLEGAKRISLLLQYFQKRPIFTSQSHPGLEGDGIYKLQAELHTLSFQEQNELWGSLKVAYHPSLLYKLSVLILEDATPSIPGEVGNIDNRIDQR